MFAERVQGGEVGVATGQEKFAIRGQASWEGEARVEGCGCK